MKNLISLPDIFADIINVNIFKGETYIHAENLENIGTEYPVILSDERNRYRRQNGNSRHRKKRSKQKHMIYFQRFRDVAMEANEGEIVIFGGEAQHDIDYTMPQRLMLLNSLEYEKQIRRIQIRNELDQINIPKTQRIGEWQKLNPVITFVVYTGSAPWSGPKNLFDMVSSLPERYRDELQNYIGGYPIIIVDAAHMKRENIDQYTSDFRIFLEAMNHFVPKGKLLHPQEVLDALIVIGSHKKEISEIIQMIDEQKEGADDMDTILDIVYEQGREQGIQVFILDNIEENIPKQRILEKLQKRFTLSALKAEEYYDRFSVETN